MAKNIKMPTKEQIYELANCTNKYVTNYKGITGLNGRIFIGYNNNFIFIPSAYYNGFTDENNIKCYLWSRSLNSDEPIYAWCLYFDNNEIKPKDFGRHFGFSIRAVYSPNI